MGSFQGHILPGFFMMLYGIRIAYFVFSRYYSDRLRATGIFARGTSVRMKRTDSASACCRSEVESSIGYYAKPFYNYSCLRPDVPIDAWLALLFTTTGFLGEWVTAFENGKFTHWHNLQHMLMYTGYAIAGAATIWCNSSRSCNTSNNSDCGNSNLIPGADYACLLLSIFVEAILFLFHLHGRSGVDIHVHQLLIITVAGCLIATVLEWMSREHPLPGLFRSYCFLVQGTWFWQIGFILYNPLPGAVPWSDHDHDQMMIVTSLFVIHMIADLIFLYLMGCLIHKWVHRRAPNDFHDVPYQSIVCEDVSDTSMIIAQTDA